MLRNYKDLKVWQKAYTLCLKIYRVTRDFPKEEMIGYGSGAELETQLMLSKDLGYVKEKEYQEVIDIYQEVERMLSALINSLKRK